MNELLVGTAAEYLVCADLLLFGYHAFRADQAAPYDVAVDFKGKLIRVQVKSTMIAKPYPQADQKHITGYTWHCRRGKKHHSPYDPESFDVLALVALDTRKIGYLHISMVRQTIQVPLSGMKTKLGSARKFEEMTFEKAMRIIPLGTAL